MFWTSEEIDKLRAHYAAGSPPLRLAVLAADLGRHKTNVCRKARALGLSDQHRRKVITRKPPRPPMFASAVERKTAQGAAMRLRLQSQGHPRGALGMKHTEAMSARNAKNIAEGKFHPYSRAKRGYREDLNNTFFRSAWEANYARYLNLMIKQGKCVSWEFEKHTFWFESIRRGVRSYTPDFRVVFPDGHHEWHEVKGWMDPKSATKLARMKKYHPTERVQVIGEAWFKQANRGGLAASIPGWERGRGDP